MKSFKQHIKSNKLKRDKNGRIVISPDMIGIRKQKINFNIDDKGRTVIPPDTIGIRKEDLNETYHALTNPNELENYADEETRILNGRLNSHHALNRDVETKKAFNDYGSRKSRVE